MDLSRP